MQARILDMFEGGQKGNIGRACHGVHFDSGVLLQQKCGQFGEFLGGPAHLGLGDIAHEQAYALKPGNGRIGGPKFLLQAFGHMKAHPDVGVLIVRQGKFRFQLAQHTYGYMLHGVRVSAPRRKVACLKKALLCSARQRYEEAYGLRPLVEAYHHIVLL